MTTHDLAALGIHVPTLRRKAEAAGDLRTAMLCALVLGDDLDDAEPGTEGADVRDSYDIDMACDELAATCGHGPATPELPITRDDIRDLEDEAGTAGDQLQALICRLALGKDVTDRYCVELLAANGWDVDDDTASARAVAECERVIRQAIAEQGPTAVRAGR